MAMFSRPEKIATRPGVFLVSGETQKFFMLGVVLNEDDEKLGKLRGISRLNGNAVQHANTFCHRHSMNVRSRVKI